MLCFDLAELSDVLHVDLARSKLQAGNFRAQSHWCRPVVSRIRACTYKSVSRSFQCKGVVEHFHVAGAGDVGELQGR